MIRGGEGREGEEMDGKGQGKEDKGNGKAMKGMVGRGGW